MNTIVASVSRPLMMSDLEFLQGVRVLLSGPEKWTQGRIARGASGEPRPWDSELATCWCLVGAGEKVIKYTPREQACASLVRLLDLPEVTNDKPQFYGTRKVSLFNDAPETTFEMVASKLDDAIARELAKLKSSVPASLV